VVSSKILLLSPREIPKVVLAPSFPSAWTDYRDLLPLKPGIAISVIAPNDRDCTTDPINNI
jgi:hypothetical protein